MVCCLRLERRLLLTSVGRFWFGGLRQIQFGI